MTQRTTAYHVGHMAGYNKRKLVILLLILGRLMSVGHTAQCCRYQTAMTGHRLTGSVIQEDRTDNVIKCVILCLTRPCGCRSFNYELKNQNITEVGQKCQLNNATSLQGNSSELIVDELFNYYEKLNIKDHNSSPACTRTEPRESLWFHRQTVEDYAISHGSPIMTAITACFWIKIPTSASLNDQSFVSYAVDNYDNEFLMGDVNQLTMYIGGAYNNHNDKTRKSMTSLQLKDGKWHHICGAWSSRDGIYKMYKDGDIVGQGDGFADGRVISAGGTWVIGQDQDAVGGSFQDHQMIQGEITEVQVWDQFLSSNEIRCMSESCYLGAVGNVKSWTDFIINVKGKVRIVKATCP